MRSYVVRVDPVEQEPEDRVDRVGDGDQAEHHRAQAVLLGQVAQGQGEQGRQGTLDEGEQQGEGGAAVLRQDHGRDHRQDAAGEADGTEQPEDQPDAVLKHFIGAPVDLHRQEAHHGEGDQVELHQRDAAGARVALGEPVAQQAAQERANGEAQEEDRGNNGGLLGGVVAHIDQEGDLEGEEYQAGDEEELDAQQGDGGDSQQARHVRDGLGGRPRHDGPGGRYSPG